MMNQSPAAAPLSRRSLVLSAAGAVVAATCAPLAGALAGEAGAGSGAASATTVAGSGIESMPADTAARLLSETPGAHVTKSEDSYLISTKHYSVELPYSLFPEGFVWTYSDGIDVDYFGNGDGPFSGYLLDIYADGGAEFRFGVYCATEGFEGTGFMSDLGPSPADASWRVRVYTPSSQNDLETYAKLVTLAAGETATADGSEATLATAPEGETEAGGAFAPLPAGGVVATPYYEVAVPEDVFRGDWGWRYVDKVAEFLSPEATLSSDKGNAGDSGSTSARCGLTLKISPEEGGSLNVSCCSEGWLSSLGTGPAVEVGTFEREGETWHVFAHSTQSVWPSDRIAEARAELAVPETGPSLDEFVKMVTVTYSDDADGGTTRS